jgi:hypothetical protein
MKRFAFAFVLVLAAICASSVYAMRVLFPCTITISSLDGTLSEDGDTITFTWDDSGSSGGTTNYYAVYVSIASYDSGSSSWVPFAWGFDETSSEPADTYTVASGGGTSGNSISIDISGLTFDSCTDYQIEFTPRTYSPPGNVFTASTPIMIPPPWILNECFGFYWEQDQDGGWWLVPGPLPLPGHIPTGKTAAPMVKN